MNAGFGMVEKEAPWVIAQPKDKHGTEIARCILIQCTGIVINLYVAVTSTHFQWYGSTSSNHTKKF